ncbi:LytR/AlgR family response regulator transcription factor [Flavilitoribacter nigricans]|nr:LytTR family transcriptional regulator DNA-binding domain-containing protein [Flavilitoribacter nigricans]
MDHPVKVLIVEDETVIAAGISVDLDELGYEVTGMVTRAEQALAHCRQTPPDIILLDIKLKGEMDGIQLAHQLNEEIDIPIIFLTANADEATFNRAKETLPFAFLSKPYKKLDLQRTLALVVSRLQAENTSGHSDHNQDNAYILSDRIFVRYKDKMVKVVIEDILYIKADGNYCLIATNDKDYILTVPLKTLEESLPSTHFMRTHRSFVVNLNKIEALTDNQEFLTLGGNKHVPVSRRFKPEVLNRLRLF